MVEGNSDQERGWGRAAVRFRSAVLAWTAVSMVTVSSASGQIQYTANTLTRDTTLDAVAKGKVAELGWLTGKWRAEALGGVVDEVWLEQAGGALSGMFRLSNDEGVQFYEIFAIREVEGTLVLNLKHFNADVTGWEEKEETEDFHLVKLEPKAAYFDGLTYRYVSDDEIESFVVVKNGDGSLGEYSFHFRRVE